MIIVFLKTIVYFFLSLIYFYSITGYGKLLANPNFIRKDSFNFFELPIFGIIVQLIGGYFIYLTIGTNFFINTALIILGLILFFFYKKELNRVNIKHIVLIFFLIFVVNLISKTHEDFLLYHLFSVNEIFNNQLRIGVTKINFKFFSSSLLSYNQSLIILPFFDFKIIHLPIFLIYFLTLGYFILNCLDSVKKDERFYSLMISMILLIKFNRLSEFGYDYISHFLLLIVFHKIYFYVSEKEELVKALKIFVLCILIKPISLLFSPIPLYIVYKHNLKFLFELFIIKRFILSLMLFVLISSSFFKTGCIFYPINSTCFSKDTVFWSEKKEIKEYSEIVNLWAKEFYNKDKSRYPKIEDAEVYKKNFTWLKYWVENHFFYKIFEFLIILISIILIIYAFFVKEKPRIKKNFDNYLLLILSILSLYFWFITVPHFRFGISIIIIFVYLFFQTFLNLEVKLKRKKIFSLILFSLIILNIKNFDRINKEINRTDMYKFNNFPFYNKIEIITNDQNLEKSKFLHIEIIK